MTRPAASLLLQLAAQRGYQRHQLDSTEHILQNLRESLDKVALRDDRVTRDPCEDLGGGSASSKKDIRRDREPLTHTSLI